MLKVDSAFAPQTVTFMVTYYIEAIVAIQAWTGDDYRIISLSQHPELGRIVRLRARKDCISGRRRYLKQACMLMNSRHGMYEIIDRRLVLINDD